MYLPSFLPSLLWHPPSFDRRLSLLRKQTYIILYRHFLPPPSVKQQLMALSHLLTSRPLGGWNHLSRVTRSTIHCPERWRCARWRAEGHAGAACMHMDDVRLWDAGRLKYCERRSSSEAVHSLPVVARGYLGDNIRYAAITVSDLTLPNSPSTRTFLTLPDTLRRLSTVHHSRFVLPLSTLRHPAQTLPSSGCITLGIQRILARRNLSYTTWSYKNVYRYPDLSILHRLHSAFSDRYTSSQYAST